MLVSYAMKQLSLTILEETFAICKLNPDAEIPDWVDDRPFLSITRTEDELSLCCPEAEVPADLTCERGWRCIKCIGPYDFSLVGILESVIEPLREAGISIYAISTYETDYVFVKAENLENAVKALSDAGHDFIP